MCISYEPYALIVCQIRSHSLGRTRKYVFSILELTLVPYTILVSYSNSSYTRIMIAPILGPILNLTTNSQKHSGSILQLPSYAKRYFTRPAVLAGEHSAATETGFLGDPEEGLAHLPPPGALPRHRYGGNAQVRHANYSSACVSFDVGFVR